MGQDFYLEEIIKREPTQKDIGEEFRNMEVA